MAARWPNNAPMAQQKNLDLGDTVRLAIGGPLMSVLSASEEDCCCFWFNEHNRLEHGRFDLDLIELVEPAPRGVWSAHQGAAVRLAFQRRAARA